MMLRPIRDFASYSSPIAQAIFKQLDDLIYAPLLATLRSNDILNAKESALADALRRGVIEYRDGYFVGNLRAAITKELRSLGARYNLVRKVYYLDLNQMPQEILQAIAAGKQASSDILAKINSMLFAMEDRNPATPKVETFLGDTLEKLSKQFYTTTRVVTAEDLEVPMRPQLMDQLKEAYTTNLEKYIKGWHDQAVLRLRAIVDQNAQEGFRASNLYSQIRSERKVSYNKAVFLAKQETSLLTASYREIRYKDIGINRYVWSTSHDERVRHDHRELNGEVFDFEHPPVTNQKTGARNNPGEDYGCRCVAIPYITGGINFIEPNKLMESANA